LEEFYFSNQLLKMTYILCHLIQIPHLICITFIYLLLIVLRYRKHIDTQIKSEADFQIFDKLVQATIIIDTKGNVFYLNEAVTKLFEITEAEMKGKNIKLFMPANHAAQHDSYLNNYITTGKKKIIGDGRDVAIKSKSGIYLSDNR
jgi:PAS domain S-box-containing protein